MNFNTSSNAQDLINNLKRNGGGSEPVTISNNGLTVPVGFVVYTSEEDKRNAEKFFSEVIANSRTIEEAREKILDLMRSNNPNCNCTNSLCDDNDDYDDYYDDYYDDDCNDDDNDINVVQDFNSTVEQFIKKLLED